MLGSLNAYHIVYFNICTYDFKINYRQASPVCCSSWGLKELDTTERLNKTNNYYTIQGEGACGWGCFPFTSGQEKKLGKPLKELNVCFVLFGRHGRLDSELYLKYLKHESLEEVAKGCLGEAAAVSESVTAKELWFFFSPKTGSGWIIWKKVCLRLSWFLPKRRPQWKEIKREALGTWGCERNHRWLGGIEMDLRYPVAVAEG